MPRQISVRSAISTLVTAALLASATIASAITPTVAWQRPDGRGGVFSADGAAVLVTTSTGFELNRATDGALLGRLTLPASSLGYRSSSFSPDKKLIALAIESGAVRRIELWSVSTGNLVRTITTDATRAIRAVSLSNTFVASMERFAYGGGGMLRVYRVSDGGLATKQGPFISNSDCKVSFSPNGQFLALRDNRTMLGIRILNTANWSAALTIGNNVALLQWMSDSASLWTYGSSTYGLPFQQISVPSGTVRRSVMVDDALMINESAVTPSSNFFLGSQPASTSPGSPPGDVVDFVSATSGSLRLTYKFPSPIVWSGTINPAGTLFTYTICINGTDCTFYVAKMPTL